MASDLLFETDAIDLGALTLDRKALERWLPHRGQMLLLDGLVWRDDDFNRGIAVKHVRDDEFWCAGHIPDYPLMPGVLMIEAGAQLSSVLYYMRSGKEWFAGFTRIENTVFRGQVRPGDDLYILCVGLKYNPKRFVTQIQGVVNNEIVFDSTITGMAFPNVLPGVSVVAGNRKTTEAAPRP
ncbi:MAG: hypothetical protein KDA16_03215 [Phycisphaerales bacterium]|nr:hypothetical protein [Phycisphaerales bacterium]